MTENLKRCPFCGEKAVIQKIALGGGDFGFRVACSGNRCRAATYVMETRKEAKTEWNNRPVENELNTEIARLRGNIKAIKKIVDKTPLSIYAAARIYAECCDALKGNENEG